MMSQAELSAIKTTAIQAALVVLHLAETEIGDWAAIKAAKAILQDADDRIETNWNQMQEDVVYDR